MATQGPLPDTAAEFWRMVWELKCATIVMLVKEREQGRVSASSVIVNTINDSSFRQSVITTGQTLVLKHLDNTRWSLILAMSMLSILLGSLSW